MALKTEPINIQDDYLVLPLEKRLQYERIGSHVSDIRELNAGAPQGTIAGPNDFKVLIDDLHFDPPYIK